MFTQTLINYLLVGLVTNMNKSPKHLEVETLKKKKKLCYLEVGMFIPDSGTNAQVYFDTVF